MKTLKLLTKRLNLLLHNLWFKYVLTPIQERIKLNTETKNKELAKKIFESKHNVKLDRIKFLMFGKSKEERQEFLENELVVSAKHANKVQKYVKSPFFYEPDICDIHNENPNRGNYPSLKDIHFQDKEITNKLLQEQTDNKKTIFGKGRFLWLTRA